MKLKQLPWSCSVSGGGGEETKTSKHVLEDKEQNVGAKERKGQLAFLFGDYKPDDQFSFLLFIWKTATYLNHVCLRMQFPALLRVCMLNHHDVEIQNKEDQRNAGLEPNISSVSAG